MVLRIFIILLLFVSCSENIKKPSYISFEHQNDSIFVIAKNNVISTSFLKIEDKINKKDTIFDFNKPNTLTVLKFHKSKIDTNAIYKNYKFTLNYGASSAQEYDTLYNYGLPFLKGKRYKVLQAQNTNFTHKGAGSKYAIDFKMNVGQEICAIRGGVVVKTKSDSNKGGSSKKYLKEANIIFVFHNDGTFAQYAHLKKDGVLVKVGDTIKKGQVIGYSGNTGMSTEPHLHFVVYKPTKNGLVSFPYILDSIPTKRYKKGRYAYNN
ncbi:M23 family metallopeptidase [Polaribacter haliotis]|uniref:M23 family metallopeptidase n=1 Tax=Polaribacter haliotis TaxID=1888915 RepID=A0A7L8AJQ3_9FLAO|nr:M23 family metallopeptidase [Polaribacter haliotis]QOD62194.1 M23 family metallopeptidase [Polaribacter haliotis]